MCVPYTLQIDLCSEMHAVEQVLRCVCCFTAILCMQGFDLQDRLQIAGCRREASSCSAYVLLMLGCGSYTSSHLPAAAAPAAAVLQGSTHCACTAAPAADPRQTATPAAQLVKYSDKQLKLNPQAPPWHHKEPGLSVHACYK
jgi:hypothetical protein